MSKKILPIIAITLGLAACTDHNDAMMADDKSGDAMMSDAKDSEAMMSDAMMSDG